VSDTKIKVLVAEDEVQLGQILSNFLGGRGYVVRTVTDGARALIRCAPRRTTSRCSTS
jgi:CheY-like chemotaxis protein